MKFQSHEKGHKSTVLYEGGTCSHRDGGRTQPWAYFPPLTALGVVQHHIYMERDY
jgi:hypothetical protein